MITPEKISEVTLIRPTAPKMVNFLKPFFILISFHSLSSHPDVAVFEDNQDVNDGRTKRLKVLMIIVTMMLQNMSFKIFPRDPGDRRTA